jgi:hypothetical protein
MNVYVLLEPGDALVIETGAPVHEGAVLDALAGLVTDGTALSVRVGLGEFFSVGNVRAIAERFGIDAVYSPLDDRGGWVDFRPETSAYGAPLGQGALADIDYRVVRRGEMMQVGTGGRQVETLDAPLRLLPINWLYDEQTKTLFTAEAFTHVWRPTASGQWVVTEDNDDMTKDDVWDYLKGSRFWWLPGASTDDLRHDVADIFDTHEVVTIAPMFGCALHGKAVVERHVALLDGLLADAEMQEPIGVDAGLWPLRIG